MICMFQASAFIAAAFGQVYGQETPPGVAAALWSFMDNANSILNISSTSLQAAWLLFGSAERALFP